MTVSAGASRAVVARRGVQHVAACEDEQIHFPLIYWRPLSILMQTPSRMGGSRSRLTATGDAGWSERLVAGDTNHGVEGPAICYESMRVDGTPRELTLPDRAGDGVDARSPHVGGNVR